MSHKLNWPIYLCVYERFSQIRLVKGACAQARSISIPMSAGCRPNRKDAASREEVVRIVFFDAVTLCALFSWCQIPLFPLCSHPVTPNLQTAEARGAPSLSCCWECSWCICCTPPGCCTASSTPNPAMEAGESPAFLPTWLPNPDCRLVQAVFYS